MTLIIGFVETKNKNNSQLFGADDFDNDEKIAMAFALLATINIAFLFYSLPSFTIPYPCFIRTPIQIRVLLKGHCFYQEWRY